MLRRALFCITVIGAASAGAQIVVDPGGGGHYRDLQTALDAAPPGAIVRVVGGRYAPITVRKPVTIVGDPPPLITHDSEGLGAQPPAILLQGPGGSRVALRDVVVAGVANGLTWNACGEAIAGDGFAELQLYGCSLSAARWLAVSGDAAGAAAVRVHGLQSLVVARSLLRASDSTTDNRNRFGPDGPPGVAADGATVLLLDCEVRGGNGAESRWDMGPPAPQPCPCANRPGRGGDALVARLAHVAGSRVEPGRGGRVSVSPDNGRTWLPWGQQPDGEPFAVDDLRLLADDPLATSALRIGAPWELLFVQPRPTPSLLVLASGLLPQPWTFAGRPLFVDPGALLGSLPLAPGTGRARLDIPAIPGLLGLTLAVQHVDLGIGRVVVDVFGR